MCCAVLSRFSRVQLFTALLTVAHQAPLSMGFARQEYQWVSISFSSMCAYVSVTVWESNKCILSLRGELSARKPYIFCLDPTRLQNRLLIALPSKGLTIYIIKICKLKMKILASNYRVVISTHYLPALPSHDFLTSLPSLCPCLPFFSLP